MINGSRLLVIVVLIITLLTAVFIGLAYSETLDKNAFPLTPSFTPQEGDDQVIPVTVMQMRQALWYHDLYLVARQGIFDYDASLQTAIKHENLNVKKIDELDLKLNVWRGIAVGTSAALIAIIVVSVVK